MSSKSKNTTLLNVCHCHADVFQHLTKSDWKVVCLSITKMLESDPHRMWPRCRVYVFRLCVSLYGWHNVNETVTLCCEVILIHWTCRPGLVGFIIFQRPRCNTNPLVRTTWRAASSHARREHINRQAETLATSEAVCLGAEGALGIETDGPNSLIVYLCNLFLP